MLRDPEPTKFDILQDKILRVVGLVVIIGVILVAGYKTIVVEEASAHEKSVTAEEMELRGIRAELKDLNKNLKEMNKILKSHL